MGAKKNKKEGDKKPSDDQKNNNDGGKKDSGSITVVLKTDMHCEGCANKIKKCIQGFKGVESLKGDDKDSNKLSVTGKVDPEELREKLERKTRKKVELVSPLPKKADKDKDKVKDKDSGGGEKKNEEKAVKKPEDEKKSKEPPLTTAVFKLNLHCEGCIQKVHKLISKTKGYQERSIDRQKDLVTVKGTMDMKAMAEALEEKLKRPVEIIPAKKEGGGGDKKEKGGGDKEKGKGEGKAAANGGGEGKAAANSGGENPNSHKLEYVPYPYPYPYPYPHPHPPPQPPMASDYTAHFPVHAPQIFSDENPNACSVM